MQFLRDSLSLSFTSQQGSRVPGGENGGTRNVEPSPTASHASNDSKYDTVRSKAAMNLGSPPSAYSTPFQSPIIPSRTFPTISGAATTLGAGPARGSVAGSVNGGKTDRASKVYFIDQGQLPPEYELPERPTHGDGGVVNPVFANDSGATVITVPGSQPSVIREQYWTWSCRCRHEFTPREKVLVIVIFVLVLIIGGLAAYLGIVIDSDDGLPGGILTNGMLMPAAHL
ncbi:uncharacterized protein LOC128271528 [Anopheles cruzii]|uniref:uncharacterized protein LOC128271528 n=1 Tax=Anopheles cruzii TaxID=68878 RepID=UPI0022EC7F2F|nr:uncharacterized protein LOC128271528 [Anopheles cruzii]